MNPLLAITTRLSDWSEWHEEIQTKIPFDNPCGFKDYLSRRVLEGKARLIDLYEGGEKIGFIVYEIHIGESRELYILATHIENRPVDWTDYLELLTDELARGFNCKSKSCSTNRAGLIKKLTSKGFRIAEVTLRKEVT